MTTATKTTNGTAQQIKAAIRHYWACYRWSQRQVAARPESHFEWGVLEHNRFAVKSLIADYRQICCVACRLRHSR